MDNASWERSFRLEVQTATSCGHFILDFYCAKLKLAIELDGEGHMDQGGKAGDDIRTGELQRLGITVIRFENAVVVEGGELVLRRILQEIDSLQRCSKV